MCKVLIIFTEHRESGKCNSDELLKILESIKPDVIFEEEHNDDHYYSQYNDDNNYNSLEILTIKKYKQNHYVNHVPVDKPINEFVSLQVLELLTRFFEQNPIYNKLQQEHCLLRNTLGFRYLNSNKCLELSNMRKLVEEEIVSKSVDGKINLSVYYNLFINELDKRETIMLQNIYNFCSSNKIERAVFFIGFAHRDTISLKIDRNIARDNAKIEWDFYNDGE